MREVVRLPQAGMGTLAIVGDLAVAGGVGGTGAGAQSPQDEFFAAFRNLERLLGEAGIAKGAVGLVNVWIADRAGRAFIDPAWLEMFPDAPRPARKTNQAPLPDGCSVLLQAYARRGAAVEEINVPGLEHRSPLPAAARVGSWIFSSAVGGEDPATGELASDAPAQIVQAFRNVVALAEAAGGGAQSINHLWVFLSGMANSPAMLETYLRLFPSDHDRPARKTVPYELPPGAHVQVQFVGDCAGRRTNFEVPGVSHHDPIPLASSAGGLLLSSGIHGLDPYTLRIVTGGVKAETEVALAHLAELMRRAGGLDAVAGLTVLLRDYADMPLVRAAVEDLFAPAPPPALHFAAYRLPAEVSVQFHVTAAGV